MQESIIPPSREELLEADEEVGIVQLVTGKTGKGEDFYAYISVMPSKFEEFMLISRAKEAMNLPEFGEVLESGFGTEPSAEVKKMMEEKYGVDHDYLNTLKKQVEEAKAVFDEI